MSIKALAAAAASIALLAGCSSEPAPEPPGHSGLAEQAAAPEPEPEPEPEPTVPTSWRDALPEWRYAGIPMCGDVERYAALQQIKEDDDLLRTIYPDVSDQYGARAEIADAQILVMDAIVLMEEMDGHGRSGSTQMPDQVKQQCPDLYGDYHELTGR